jgi:hypothetical protein
MCLLHRNGTYSSLREDCEDLSVSVPWVTADRHWVRCLCTSSVCLVSKLNLHVLEIDLAPTFTVLCPFPTLQGSFQAIMAHNCYSIASLPVFMAGENLAPGLDLYYS